jgi:ABC-2 type transport system ATP-binding protein
MMRTPIISLQEVTKSYPAFELGPIDLDIHAGRVVAIVGPNGGGKSTLMRMLMNLIHPTSGRISLFGGAYPEDEVAIKQRIGYAPEHTSGYEDLSPEFLRALVSHFYPDWDQGLYEDLIADVAVRPKGKVGKLSAGTQRRLTFALAVATGADLLLLDEPTTGLDPLARRRVVGGISRFMADKGYRGRTVVFATHRMDEVRLIADHVAFLVDGELLGFFEMDALLEGWRHFWVDRAPEGDVPGMIELQSGDPARIVSGSALETEEALRARNIQIFHGEALELEEILSHLMRRREERRIKSPYTGE